jgi:hypothetical protein
MAMDFAEWQRAGFSWGIVPGYVPPAQPTGTTDGTKDGKGAGDHDVPFTFGHRPTMGNTFPFSTLQYAKLLVLRGRVQDGVLKGDTEADPNQGGF